MNPTRLELGSVIWAKLQDANGVSKVRPAVVVSGTADIESGGPRIRKEPFRYGGRHGQALHARYVGADRPSLWRI